MIGPSSSSEALNSSHGQDDKHPSQTTMIMSKVTWKMGLFHLIFKTEFIVVVSYGHGDLYKLSPLIKENSLRNYF